MGKDVAEERGWLCPLDVQLSENWIFILPGTKQSQPKPEIIITKESCLGSSHQPGEQLVWDFLKRFFFYGKAVLAELNEAYCSGEFSLHMLKNL